MPKWTEQESRERGNLIKVIYLLEFLLGVTISKGYITQCVGSAFW